MLASISPFGERARRQSYAITVLAFIATSTMAAALFGALLGELGASVAPEVGLTIIGLAAFAGLLFDTPVVGWRVPGPRRQVNEDWLVVYRGWVYGAGFGAQLGLGVTTIVVASLTWVALGCALFSGSVLGGTIVGATFGLARALPILATARVRDATRLRSLMGSVERGRPHIARATLALQVAFGVGVLALAAGRIA